MKHGGREDRTHSRYVGRRVWRTLPRPIGVVRASIAVSLPSAAVTDAVLVARSSPLPRRRLSTVDRRRCIASRDGACQSVGLYPADGTVRGGLARVAARSYDRTVRAVAASAIRETAAESRGV